LEQQADAMMLAVASIFESHRWFGPFLQDQLSTTLTGIAETPSVLAVAVAVRDSAAEDRFETIFSAGSATSIDLSLPEGGHWNQAGYVVVHPFELSTSPPHGRMQRQEGSRGGGIGPGAAWKPHSNELERFKTVLVIDRVETDMLIAKERRNRTIHVSLSGLLLLLLGTAWQTSVRLARARGAAQVLESETRHLRELGQAAAGLAHETRNPLGLIRGWTQRLVADGLPSEEQQREAEAALEECDRVTARINQFLAFARPPALTLQPTCVGKMAKQLKMLLEPDLEGHSIRIDTEQLDPDLSVHADGEQLRQAVFNLLQNAIQFSPDDGSVRIELHVGQGGNYRLAVLDEGPGPPPDSIETLFEPYTTSRPNGTGLGLAIVQRIASAHGWCAGYSPRPEGGSAFWLDGLKPAVR
jgi:signal transduction histidine kinase